MDLTTADNGNINLQSIPINRDVPQRKKWDGATKFFQNFRSLDTTFQKWGGAEHSFSIL
jgi:hypothetical protein